jgi:hypothetical protein
MPLQAEGFTPIALWIERTTRNQFSLDLIILYRQMYKASPRNFSIILGVRSRRSLLLIYPCDLRKPFHHVSLSFLTCKIEDSGWVYWLLSNGDKRWFLSPLSYDSLLILQAVLCFSYSNSLIFIFLHLFSLLPHPVGITPHCFKISWIFWNGNSD